jgi:parvulin-like peptidyl-prolyl isomerase
MKLFLLISGLVVGAVLSTAAEPVVIDGIESVVSSRVVTHSEVVDYSRPALEALHNQYGDQPDVFEDKSKATMADSLEQLVERELILRSFDTEGYKLPDSVVDELVQDRIRERFYNDRVTFIKTIQAQGQTVEQFRKQVREQYIEAALRNQNVQREVLISPYQIEQYYLANQDEFRLEDQVRLRMIVLAKSAPDDTNAVKLAHEILTKIKDGTPFAEMALIYSQGSQQSQAGDAGWQRRSILRQELADAVDKLAPGQVSDVIETPDNCYLLLVEEKQAAHVRPLTEVAADIEKTLRLKKQAKLQKDWIDGLKKKTFIHYFPN